MNRHLDTSSILRQIFSRHPIAPSASPAGDRVVLRWAVTFALLGASLLLSAPGEVAAQDAPPAIPHLEFQLDPGEPFDLHLGLKPLSPSWSADAFRGVPTDLGGVQFSQSFEAWAAERVRATREAVAARRALAWEDARMGEPVTAPDSVEYLPREEIVPEQDTADDLLPGAMSRYADLGIQVNGRAEMGGAWNRREPCSASFQINCNAGLIPRISPDIQFGVQVGGTVSERVHVNVDYDQAREFDAANNIQVYYEGLEDEILQRVEVGDISLSLPNSRFLTQGVPAGNFGFKVTGQLGPLDFQSVWAEQGGNVTTQEFRPSGQPGTDRGLVQERVSGMDDTEYESGRFFFLVDPAELTGAPHVDVLELQAVDAPASIRPSAGSIEVYRYESDVQGDPQQQAQLGYFRADAVAPADDATHSGFFRQLIPGEDYEVHSSGLWITMRTPLRSSEALATSYQTSTGQAIGTPGAATLTGDVTPRLRLIRGPDSKHQPAISTWPFEMRQIYLLDRSSGVDPSTVLLEISLNDIARGETSVVVGGEQVPYLALFGLDEDSPTNQLDDARLFRPADASGEDSRIGGTYVVFPTLQPFGDPPPVPSRGLTDEQTETALGQAANTAIYDDPNPTTRANSSAFRLNFEYQVSTEGVVSSFDLGAIGIRQGSERITVGGNTLTRDVDYAIDYELGVVTLSDPDRLFATNPDAEIRATWEQKAEFAVAPTTVFGMNTAYDLGERGQLNLLAMYQSEKTLMARPQLGTEPNSIFLGGLGGEIDLGAGLLDRMVGAVPGLRASGTSSMGLRGEVALSSPDPNTAGETYVDDFESTDEIQLGVGRFAWRLGSVPGDPIGALGVLPTPLSAGNAASLVWQAQYQIEGQILGPIPTQNIDEQIQSIGSDQREPVLYLTFGDSASDGSEAWRSMTTVLSSSGRDMSQSEHLEFYADTDRLTLVFDIGEVAEDAFYFDETGALEGVDEDGEPWGRGILDQEGDPGRDVWPGPGEVLDRKGLWNQDCMATPGAAFLPGDPRVNCTRGNGTRDTEDLNGDGNLTTEDGQYFRYTVELGDDSPYVVRDTAATGTQFRLYRIPLRGSDAIPVNGANENTWRFINHLRMTVVGSPEGRVFSAIARPRIVGSRWPKRGDDGLLRGLTGTEPEPGGATANFRVGPVSSITASDYSSPPGVSDRPQDPTSGLQGGTVEFNDRSLRLSTDALPADTRAEAYFHYAQEARNFLDYRTLRLWAVARRGEWGEGGDQELLVKLGTDAENYYVYRAPLEPVVTGVVSPMDWVDIAVDFEKWFALKAEAERRIIESGGSVDEPIEEWSEDGRHGVVVNSRARAPNLAAIRELSFAIHNGGELDSGAEVWLNDLRLGTPVTDPGVAGQIDFSMRASDFVSANVSYSSEGAFFRNGLDGDPRYQRAGGLRLNSTVELGRFAPSSWGLSLPVRVEHTRSSTDPHFLSNSDVRADQLENLRETGGSQTRVGVSLRKNTPTADPWLSLLLDGFSINGNYRRSSTSAITSRAESSSLQGSLNYSRQPGAREVDAVPDVVENALRSILPDIIGESGIFERMVGSRLRWSPQQISFSHDYTRGDARSFRYNQILELPADDTVSAIRSPSEGLRSTARIALTPFQSLRGDFSMNTRRDMLDPEDATTRDLERSALAEARSSLAGMDLGWERDRNMTSQMSFRPELTPWLQPGYSYSATYSTNRSPSYLEIDIVDDDSTATLQRNFSVSRQVNRTLSIEPVGLVGSALGPPAGDGSIRDHIHRALRRINPLDLSWGTRLRSNFERENNVPGVGYQFGFGGMEGLRVVDGDTARVISTQSNFRASTGLRLPYSANLTAAYTSGEGERIDLQGGRTLQDQRDWPDLRLRLNELPMPGFVEDMFSRASLTTGYTRREEGDFLASSEQRRGGSSTSFPLSLDLGLNNGITLTYAGNWTGGEGREPTGRTEQRSRSHRLTARSMFDAPSALATRFDQPIRASLSLNVNSDYRCRVRDESCTAYQDLVRRGVDFTLDTNVSDLVVGVNASYNGRQSGIGVRSGSSQFELNIFGQFNFATGSFPSGSRGAPGVR